MTTAQIDQLKTQLRQFGLNPREWTLKARPTGQAELKNRRDRTFRLRGEFTLEPKCLRWNEISVVSL